MATVGAERLTAPDAGHAFFAAGTHIPGPPHTEGRLALHDFGVFEVHVTKPRKGRRPKSGIEVMVPEGRRVKSKMGKIMDEKVNNGATPPSHH